MSSLSDPSPSICKATLCRGVFSEHDVDVDSVGDHVGRAPLIPVPLSIMLVTEHIGGLWHREEVARATIGALEGREDQRDQPGTEVIADTGVRVVRKEWLALSDRLSREARSSTLSKSRSMTFIGIWTFR